MWNFGGGNASNKIRTEDIHGGLVALSLIFIIYDNGLDKYNTSDNLLHEIGKNTYLFQIKKYQETNISFLFLEYLDGTGENITEQRQASNLSLVCTCPSTINKSIWTDSCPSKQLNSKGVSIRDGCFWRWVFQ